MSNITPIFGKEFPKKVIPLIDQAKQSLKIVVFDWRWYSDNPGCAAQLFNASILRAKNRGVNVSVVVPPRSVAAILRSEGCKVKEQKLKKLIHAKIMIIDEKILVIGSHNYTQSAFTINQEVSLILDNCLDLSSINKFFNSLFLNDV